MANHPSAEKRARQNIVRRERNQFKKASVRTLSKAALNAKPEEQKAALSRAYSVIQKARGVLNRSAVKRKMSRLAKAVNRTKKAAGQS